MRKGWRLRGGFGEREVGLGRLCQSDVGLGVRRALGQAPVAFRRWLSSETSLGAGACCIQALAWERDEPWGRRLLHSDARVYTPVSVQTLA